MRNVYLVQYLYKTDRMSNYEMLAVSNHYAMIDSDREGFIGRAYYDLNIEGIKSLIDKHEINDWGISCDKTLFFKRPYIELQTSYIDRMRLYQRDFKTISIRQYNRLQPHATLKFIFEYFPSDDVIQYLKDHGSFKWYSTGESLDD